jgi:hypothetical protein
MYDPEKGGARDLPRERYLAAAYRLLRKQGSDLLILIATRGEDEFQRVAGQIFGANGFHFTKDEYRAMFRGLERQAKKLDTAEKLHNAFMDAHARASTPHGASPFDELVDRALLVNAN